MSHLYNKFSNPNIKVKAGKLFLRSFSLEELAEKFGTPLYLVDAERIEARYIEVYKALSKYFTEFNVAYSYKANHSLSVVKLLANLGAGATIVSSLGLELALVSGVSPSKIVFDGPSKSSEELTQAINTGVGIINAESFEELLLINSIAQNLNCVANVGVRVNLNIRANTHKKISTGLLSHKFGVSSNDLIRFLPKIKKLKNVSLIGLHSHIGSQILSLEPFAEQAKILAKLYSRVIKEFKVPLSTVDLGGGLGISYKVGDSNISYEDYASVVFSEIKSIVSKEGVNFPKIVVEPGRYIVADSSILLTKINYVKKLGNKKWLLVDAGMNDFIRVALYEAYHEILPTRKLNRKFLEKYNVGGPICESSDVFALNRKLPVMKSGELLAILDVGAYGLSMASNYNVRPIPRVIMVWKDKVKIVREKESLEDIIKKEKVPD
jgi:diaminopimelate decarboxylase